MRTIYTVKLYEIKLGIKCFVRFKDFFDRYAAKEYADQMLHEGYAVQVFQNSIAD